MISVRVFNYISEKSFGRNISLRLNLRLGLRLRTLVNMGTGTKLYPKTVISLPPNTQIRLHTYFLGRSGYVHVYTPSLFDRLTPSTGPGYYFSIATVCCFLIDKVCVLTRYCDWKMRTLNLSIVRLFVESWLMKPASHLFC